MRLDLASLYRCKRSGLAEKLTRISMETPILLEPQLNGASAILGHKIIIVNPGRFKINFLS